MYYIQYLIYEVASVYDVQCYLKHDCSYLVRNLAMHPTVAIARGLKVTPDPVC